MKLNFFSILKGEERHTPEDVAIEIAKLERLTDIYQKEYEVAQEESVRLRQENIGGGKVTSKELESAREHFDDARLDLEAARSALKTLNEKLKESVATEREEKLNELESERIDFKNELLEQKKRIIKAIAAVQALQIEIYGNSGGQVILEHEDNLALHDELERLTSRMEHPTFHERKSSSELERERLRQETIEVTITNLLTGARSNFKEEASV